MPLTEEVALKIASSLKKHQGERGVVSIVSQEVGVKGTYIKPVRQMMENGMIGFHENDEPYFVMPFEEIMETISKKSGGKSREDISKSSVQKTIEEHIAKEGKANVEQYIVLGEAIYSAYMNWAVKKGLTPDEIANMPIHTVILEALEAADMLPEVQQELEDFKEAYKILEQQLLFLQGETDPLIRLKRVLPILNRFIEYVVTAKVLGLNIDPIIPQYEKIINSYLKGVPKEMLHA